MSKPKSKIRKKKVVVTTSNKTNDTTTVVKKKIQPTKSRRRAGSSTSTFQKGELLFNKQNYIWMGMGMVLITLGLILMSGGAMPSPDVWDESIIYSWRRTVLAPFLMVVGLVVEVYAIFKK